MISIRDELPSDIPAIHHVNRLAFERPDEADLVDLLRRGGKLLLSLVAVETNQMLGHIAFSRVRLIPAAPGLDGAGLAHGRQAPITFAILFVQSIILLYPVYN